MGIQSRSCEVRGEHCICIDVVDGEPVSKVRFAIVALRQLNVMPYVMGIVTLGLGSIALDEEKFVLAVANGTKEKT